MCAIIIESGHAAEIGCIVGLYEIALLLCFCVSCFMMLCLCCLSVCQLVCLTLKLCEQASEQERHETRSKHDEAQANNNELTKT